MAGFTIIKEAKMRGLEIVAVIKTKNKNGKEGYKLLVKAVSEANIQIARDIYKALGKNAANAVLPSVFVDYFFFAAAARS